MTPNTRVPPDFLAVFNAKGWRAAEHLFGARTSVTRRWIELCGGKDMLIERKRERKRRAK